MRMGQYNIVYIFWYLWRNTDSRSDATVSHYPFVVMLNYVAWWRHFSAYSRVKFNCSRMILSIHIKYLYYSFILIICYFTIEYLLREIYCIFSMFHILPIICTQNSIHLPLETPVSQWWLLVCVWHFPLVFFTGCSGVLVVNTTLILHFLRSICYHSFSLLFLFLD